MSRTGSGNLRSAANSELKADSSTGGRHTSVQEQVGHLLIAKFVGQIGDIVAADR